MMNQIFKMENPIQTYAWGSHTALAQLLRQSSPSPDPQAELWMGAHPRASSKIWYQRQWRDLNEVVADDPPAILGGEVVQRFGGSFPFLLKVLAVAQPLSIQAHPNQEQAEHGFGHENQLGIPLDAVNRNYRDNRPKPECVCALTPFWAMCGFRTVDGIRATLGPLWPQNQLSNLTEWSTKGGGNDLHSFIKHLMYLAKPIQRKLVAHITKSARDRIDPDRVEIDPVCRWIVDLNQAYPGDIGVLAPAILNLLCLQPGQALFLPAGQLHAYLQGVAIEVMANSDNVLRGGLTPKHIDIEALMDVLDFQWKPVKLLAPVPINPIERQYPCGAEAFVLSVMKLSRGVDHLVSNRLPSPDILLCTQGEAMIRWAGGSDPLVMNMGESVLVPAVVSEFSLTGHAVIYRASVGKHSN